MLSHAKAITRKKNWRPPTPGELFAFADQKDARLVRDGDELLEAVMESLSKLGTKLQGETPLRQFLWNEVAKNIISTEGRSRVCGPRQGRISRLI